MEVRGRKGSVELSTTNSSKPVGTVALRNFTIPRKKRVSGQVLLEPCPEDSRDYTLIQSKLKESRLDMRKEHANAWLWKDVKLVHNDGFLKEFSEKRSEMRTKGRHGREMEERFCFLLASSEATNEIYQFGLRTGSQDQYSLGKPSHGVYLFKHVDVALKHATASTCNGKNLIIFKVLFGKVKKVTPSLEWNRTVDPMVGFDCHMAKDAVSYRDSVSQQVLGSLVFLFDYNQNQELDKRPRQCLPYAVVSFAPAISAAAPTSISPPVSPNKAPASFMHGPLEHLKGCTVAKRTGKGENATVTFKRFATQGCPGVEYQPQTPTAEANGVDASPFQYNDLHTTPPFILHQAYMPYYNTTDYFNLSLPCYDSDISWQSYSDTPTFPSNVYNLNTASVYGVLVDSERNKAALLNTDNDELNQKICRPKENHVQEKERDPPPDSQTEPQDGANDVDGGSEAHLNSAAESQSGSQIHGKLLGSSQNDSATNILTEEGSYADSENKTRHGDELSQTKEQCINPAKQSAEIVHEDISNHNEIKESEENITSDSKGLVIIEEMETDSGTNHNKARHQEKSSLVTCSGSNESSNCESAEAEHKEEALLLKKLSEEDNSDTKEILTDYNTGASKDTSSPVPTVSSIPSDITSGNVISSCTAKAQTALPPDSPKVMNNETDTQTEAGILGDTAVYNSGSGLTQRLSSTNKSEKTNNICSLQDGELYPKSTDANEERFKWKMEQKKHINHPVEDVTSRIISPTSNASMPKK
ncbi:hypothetical protein QTP86_025212 [Hemibagrus guttatus]|nr:hypothetical protein QTP86_025212 [Hemibagrus guttatus]